MSGSTPSPSASMSWAEPLEDGELMGRGGGLAAEAEAEGRRVAGEFKTEWHHILLICGSYLVGIYRIMLVFGFDPQKFKMRVLQRLRKEASALVEKAEGKAQEGVAHSKAAELGSNAGLETENPVNAPSADVSMI